MKQIVTGLASFGMSGKVFHAPLLNYHSGFNLKAVVERSRDEAAASYPGISTLRSFDELINDKDIELVIVNTPDDTHFDLAMQALKAGKNVVVEKPFVQTLEHGETLIRTAEKHNRMLSVFQNRRWDGDFLTVKDIISDGLLGHLVEYEAHFDRYRNYVQANTWKEDPGTGTGALFNLGSHLIDQALSLFGMPEAVWADLRIVRTGGKVDDDFDVKLYYPSVKVTLKCSYLTREPGPRYSLHGTAGSFMKYGIDPQEEALKNGMPLSNPDWGKETEQEWGILNTQFKHLHFKGKIETNPGNYLAYYNNIYEVLRSNSSLVVRPEEALNVIKVINACKLSSESRTCVTF
ncbi:MAG TPA: oxidoreductase [Bacteroidales bacterium]|nr:oxidoreductase [Bacteroidales bacterium]